MATPGQDDARSSKFDFFAGPLKLTPVSLSGLKSERSHVDRPDRSRRVTDQPNPIEFTGVFRLKDKVQIAALKGWRTTREHIDCVVNYLTEDGDVVAIFNILQACPRDFANSDLSIEDDASEITQEWTFTADDVVQIF